MAASVVNWGSNDYFRYYNGGWSSWSTAPTYGAFCNKFGGSPSNYCVQGGCTVTPTSGRKVTQFSVTTKILRQSEASQTVTWTCYLTTNNEGWLNSAPTSYAAVASVNAAPNGSGVSVKFTFTGLNITSVTNFYMTFTQSTNLYYAIGYGGFTYSDITEVSNTVTLTFRLNGGRCTYAGTNYTADASISIQPNTSYTIGAPSQSGYQFLGWASYGSAPKSLSKSFRTDTSFTSGYNSVATYNNSGTSSHTWNRPSDSNSPRSYYGNYHLSCSVANVTTSPGSGGFYQNVVPGASQTIIHGFRVQIPSGSWNFSHNSMGTGHTKAFLTRQTAANAYVNYGYQIKTGTGSISNMSHVYFSTAKPYSFYIGYSSVWNVTNGWSMTHQASAAGTLLGVWAHNNYTVSYNANGGSSTPSSQTKYHDQALTLAAAISRNNSGNSNSFTVKYSANGGSSTPSSQTNTKYTSYAFSKWNTNSSGTGTNYAAGGSYTANAGATLYAKWTATTHQNSIKLAAAINHANGSATRTVTLNANGGSVSPTSKTSTATVTYSFEKWHSGSASGTAYAAGATYTPSANVTMYAGWTSSTGTFSAVTLPTPTRTGYTCSGWYTATSGGTKRAGAGGSYTPPGNETLYAHWTANSYTITLNKNGGAGGTDSVSIAYNTAKGSYPSITRPTRTGYTFNGYWDTSAASGGTEWYDANGNSLRTFNLTANATWYARWTKIQSVVKYYPNGGTVAPQAGGTATTTTQNYSYEYGTNQTAPTPTRTGYTFLRWSRQMNGTSEAINYGRSMMAATLRYRVYAYRNDWSNIGTERIISCTEGGGWNIESYNGNITFAVYSEGDNAYRNANSTIAWASLSAGWHCFEFVFNGTNAKGYLDGALIATSANFTAPSGYSAGRIKYHATNDLFLGDEATNTQNGHGGQYWSGKLGLFYVDGTTSGPIGPTTNPNAFRVYASTSGWTYSAEWEEITAILSFNMVGGSGGPSAITMKYTTATTIPATSTWPTRTGYTCIGWATSEARAKNGDVDYTAGDTYKAANVVPTAATLYAVWQSTVTYNANNGTGAPSPDYMYYTPAFNLSTTKPTRIGYKFKYWDTAADDSGVVKFSAGAQFKSANEWKSNITLYAIWEPYGIIRVPPSLTPSNITTNSNNSIIVDGLTFLLTIPYIYKNGSWQQHQPFGYDNGEWKVGE